MKAYISRLFQCIFFVLSQVERLELSNSSEELKEFLDETDSSLKEALSNEETCSEVLYQLRQKVEQYPEHVGMSEQKMVKFQSRWDLARFF